METQKMDAAIPARAPGPAAKLAWAGGALLLCALFFARSFVLYVDARGPAGMEACHAGAIAREILAHGFRFPIEDYAPEYHDTASLVTGLLTVIPARLWGVNRFTADLAPFVFSLGTLLLLCSLLVRGACKSGLWFFVISYFFVPGLFAARTTESMSSHVLGLFTGVLILHQFYCAYVTGGRRAYYTMMFVIGLGLFVNPASFLLAGLCFVAWWIYRPADGNRPLRVTREEKLKGILMLLLGAAPFLAYGVKTGLMSVTYLFGVMAQRALHGGRLGARLIDTAGELQSGFDGRIWLMALYLCLGVCAWAAWAVVRARSMPAEKRFLLFLACLFPAPIFAGLVIFSGGRLTGYHVYLMPFLFLSGAVVMSLFVDRFSTMPAATHTVLSLMLVAVLVSGNQAPRMNLSAGHALAAYRADRDRSFCYWRFGRAFGNHVPFEGDTAKYASAMLAACGRFDSEAKRNECLWGWTDDAARRGFKLDARAVETLGPAASGLIARSIGGGAGTILTCSHIHKAYADDCLLGVVERNAAIEYSIKAPEDRYIAIPCLPEAPRFSGLVENIRGQLRRGAPQTAVQNCPEHLGLLCLISDAYCAAVENRADFCGALDAPPDAAGICEFVYENVRKAREAKEQRPTRPVPE